MNTSSTDKPAPGPSNEPSDGLLPAFATTLYSHLPTPQSPNNFPRYVHDGPHSPVSPVPHGSLSSTLQNQRAMNRRLDLEGNPSRVPANSQQCITPESSPHFLRNSAPYPNHSATLQFFIPPSSNDFSTPKQNSFSVKLESATSVPASAATRMSTPSSPSSEQPNHSSALSSPFMAKLSIADGTKKLKLPSESQSIRVDDVFSSSRPSQPKIPASIISTPPISPPQQSASTLTTTAGGEMERIRQSMMEDRLAQLREAERRRPEYLKRAKRTLSEADPNYLEDEDILHDHDRSLAVGIMESPHKGRRLKLFQETSEESFEESLMAGGYGRYRTADWVRQPQPIALPPSAIAGSSTIVSLLEEAEELPPSEKEVKKRKRLAAFSSEVTQSNSKLFAVELEGKGRVLVDIPTEEQITPGSPEPTTNKKRVNNRRKKRGTEVLVNKKACGVSGSVGDQVEKPNWPDTEFPWRLRTQERIELAKAEEEERLRWIERFLDRDSDDEDDVEFNAQPGGDEAFSGSTFGVDYENALEKPFPMGRGKTVPLLTYSDTTRKLSKRSAFPSDPADARAALLSKKSVRALSYRQQKRQRELDDEEDDEVVCICNGKDDGRELVQCDACQTWYHLQCIGIKNIAELGKEEDPWFCRRCVARSPSPSTEPDNLVTSEPIFVPTDDEPNVRRPLDASFYPSSLQDSPNWTSSRTPRTPTRGPYNGLSNFNHSWSDSSRPRPSTPQRSGPAVRIYSSPFDDYSQNYEESPFDPTSTPSRGIKFHAPFATPKNNTWLPRANTSLFQTPSKPVGRGSRNTGSHPAISDDTGVAANILTQDHFARAIAYDESPVRRNKSSDTSAARRILYSPSRPRMSGPHLSLLEESPIVRSLGTRIHNNEPGQQRPTLDGGQRHDDLVS